MKAAPHSLNKNQSVKASSPLPPPGHEIDDIINRNINNSATMASMKPPNINIKSINSHKKVTSDTSKMNSTFTSGVKNISKQIAKIQDHLHKSSSSADKILSDSEISATKLTKYKCTLCEASINTNPCQHPKLKVLICIKCEKRIYKMASKLSDVDSSDYCSWCCYGGELVCCDNCSLSFCCPCIQRNLGFSYLKQVVLPTKKWSCFSCNPEPIKLLVQLCRLALEVNLKSFQTELIRAPTKRKHQTNKTLNKEKKQDVSDASEISFSSSSSSDDTNENIIFKPTTSHPINPISLNMESSSDSSSGKNVFVPLDKNINKKKYLQERAKKALQPSSISLKDNLVLEVDSSNKPIVSISPYISKALKAHQVEGIKFMYDITVKSLEHFKKTPSEKGEGCILAHCMGLGKSLQVIALLEALFIHCNLKTAIILSPLNACDNWSNEFDEWIPSKSVNVFKISDKTISKMERKKNVEQWFDIGGVLIISYTLFRALLQPNAKYSETYSMSMKYTLQDPGPQILICDEGHMIKNFKSQISEVLKFIKTRRRIILTGTPLQNNLMEYYYMVNLVNPGILSNSKNFSRRFCIPISKGQLIDASQEAVSWMKKRCAVLHRILKPFVQRKDFTALLPYLPQKYEYTIYIRSSETQIKLFNHMITVELNPSNSSCSFNSLFTLFQTFILIGLHPGALSIRDTRQANNLADDFDMMINPETTVATAEELSIDYIPIVDNETSKVINVIKNVKNPCTKWYRNYFDEERDMLNINLSGKLFVLNSIIEETLKNHQKIVVFSQSLACLDLISHYLTNAIMCPPNKYEKSWILYKHFYRIDGSTNLSHRSNYISLFNNRKNTSASIMLISTRAGGLGINLKGASHIVLMDCSWNPSCDVQSMFRVYRIGQDKTVYVYRLISEGVLEERIYNRQIMKLALSCRVVDKKQIERVFTHYELSDLFKVSPTPLQSTKSNNLNNNDSSKYPGLVEVIRNCYPKHIVKYIEHNSLLVDNPDQQLTEQEQDQAMNEYLNETTECPQKN
ncbi:hypothetical protein HZS_5374, partial [Henneguya salminicola]